MGTSNSKQKKQIEQLNVSNESKKEKKMITQSSTINRSYMEHLKLIHDELSIYLHKDLVDTILSYIPRCRITDERTPISTFDTYQLKIVIMSSKDLIPLKLAYTFASYFPLCKCGSLLQIYTKPKLTKDIKCPIIPLRYTPNHFIPNNKYTKCNRNECKYISCEKCSIYRHNNNLTFPYIGYSHKYIELNNKLDKIGNDIWYNTRYNYDFLPRGIIPNINFTRRIQLSFTNEYLRIYLRSQLNHNLLLNSENIIQPSLYVIVDNFKDLLKDDKWKNSMKYGIQNKKFNNQLQKIYFIHGLKSYQKLNENDKQKIKNILNEFKKINNKVIGEFYECDIIDNSFSFITFMDVIGNYISNLNPISRNNLKPTKYY